MSVKNNKKRQHEETISYLDNEILEFKQEIEKIRNLHREQKIQLQHQLQQFKQMHHDLDNLKKFFIKSTPKKQRNSHYNDNDESDTFNTIDDDDDDNNNNNKKKKYKEKEKEKEKHVLLSPSSSKKSPRKTFDYVHPEIRFWKGSIPFKIFNYDYKCEVETQKIVENVPLVDITDIKQFIDTGIIGDENHINLICDSDLTFKEQIIMAYSLIPFLRRGSFEQYLQVFCPGLYPKHIKASRYNIITLVYKGSSDEASDDDDDDGDSDNDDVVVRHSLTEVPHSFRVLISLSTLFKEIIHDYLKQFEHHQVISREDFIIWQDTITEMQGQPFDSRYLVPLDVRNESPLQLLLSYPSFSENAPLLSMPVWVSRHTMNDASFNFIVTKYRACNNLNKILL